MMKASIKAKVTSALTRAAFWAIAVRQDGCWLWPCRCTRIVPPHAAHSPGCTMLVHWKAGLPRLFPSHAAAVLQMATTQSTVLGVTLCEHPISPDRSELSRSA